MTGRRLLVTGASGFLGSWTLGHWRAAHPDVELWATDCRPEPPQSIADRFVQVDLKDPQAVQRLIREARPDGVIHLAGLVGRASLTEHLLANVVGTDNLYTALAECDPSPDLRIVQASSAATYGLVRPDDLPISEEQPRRPLTPYALSKAAQDDLAVALGRTRGLHIVRACIFNILGPGQPDVLVPMTFVKQLVAVRDGLAGGLKVGDTTPRRDFVDARDVAAAFDVLSERGRAGELYNIASGTDVSIAEVIKELFAVAGFPARVEVDSERMRPLDVPCVRADISRITTETAWRAKISLRDSLEAMWLARGT